VEILDLQKIYIHIVNVKPTYKINEHHDGLFKKTQTQILHETIFGYTLFALGPNS